LNKKIIIPLLALTIVVIGTVFLLFPSIVESIYIIEINTQTEKWNKQGLSGISDKYGKICTLNQYRMWDKTCDFSLSESAPSPTQYPIYDQGCQKNIQNWVLYDANLKTLKKGSEESQAEQKRKNAVEIALVAHCGLHPPINENTINEFGITKDANENFNMMIKNLNWFEETYANQPEKVCELIKEDIQRFERFNASDWNTAEKLLLDEYVSEYYKVKQNLC